MYGDHRQAEGIPHKHLFVHRLCLFKMFPNLSVPVRHAGKQEGKLSAINNLWPDCFLTIYDVHAWETFFFYLVQMSQVVPSDELVAGDHIYVYRGIYTYSHHGKFGLIASVLLRSC